MKNVNVYAGRGEAVRSLWASEDGELAIVKSFHDPPQYLVMKKGYNGWLKVSSHKNISAALKTVGGKLPSKKLKRLGGRIIRRSPKTSKVTWRQ